MKGAIISAMASDMNIEKFNKETETQYIQRVLYSAMSCWIKAAALDRHIGENDTSLGISKKHIYKKATQKLLTMVDRYPETRPWFYVENDAEDPARLLRRRLVQNGDLINMGFETNLTMAPKLIYTVSSNVEQLNGVFFGDGIFYSGVSTLRLRPYANFKYTERNAVEWIDDFCNTAWWEHGITQNDTKEYFNCYKNARNVHSCWQENETDFLDNIRLVRMTINKNMYEYYLEKNKNGSIYHHKIDPFLIDIKEHRKIMFALRKKANTPLPACMTIYEDHAILKLWVHLPHEIEVFLGSYAWPGRSVSDVLEWKLPLCLLEELKKKLVSLGMMVTEEQDG